MINYRICLQNHSIAPKLISFGHVRSIEHIFSNLQKNEENAKVQKYGTNSNLITFNYENVQGIYLMHSNLREDC